MTAAELTGKALIYELNRSGMRNYRAAARKIGWTDVDRSLALGAVLKGTPWGRPDDKIGLGGVVEGLSSQTRAYFAAGVWDSDAH